MTSEDPNKVSRAAKWIKEAEKSIGIRFVLIFAAFVGVAQWGAAQFISSRSDLPSEPSDPAEPGTGASSEVPNPSPPLPEVEPPIPVVYPMVPKWVEQEASKAEYTRWNQLDPDKDAGMRAPLLLPRTFEESQRDWEEYWRAGVEQVEGCWIAEDLGEFTYLTERYWFPLFFKIRAYERGIEFWSGSRLSALSSTSPNDSERYLAGNGARLYLSELGRLRMGDFEFFQKDPDSNKMAFGFFTKTIDGTEDLQVKEYLVYLPIRCPTDD